MEGATYRHEEGLEANIDLQALDHAAGQTGDVMALFDVLKGKLRPGRSTEAEGGETAKTSRGQSILQAHYDGSAGNIVLSTANIRRIHDFLNEPQKHLGQVIADIEKEVDDIYSQGGSLRHSHRAKNNYQMQRGRGGNYAAPTLKNDKRVCLEEIPEMNKYLGPRSRFGDGDGSFWDRWLTTTGHFTENGAYAKADIPTRSMYSKGAVIPKSGFKRYRLDRLAFPKNPDPRVLTYAKRRELGEAIRYPGKPKRLHGANTERSSSPTVDEWLDEVVVTNTGEDSKTAVESKERPRGMMRSCTLDPTHGGAREHSTSFRRSNSWHVAMKVEAERDEAADAAPERNKGTFGGDKIKQAIQDGGSERDRRSAEEEDTALDLIYPKYFGKQARTHLHDHFKQIVRRRHRYGKEHPGIAPSLPSSADHVGVIPAYKMTAYALVPEIKKIEPYLQPDKPDEVDVDDTGGRAGSTGGATRVLPPLATLGMPACDNAAGAREGCGEQDEGDAVTLLDFTGGSQVTSRTRFVLRCTEDNVPPRADILIRKSHTTKVNLAHQGMGDVMGRILADSLDGLPLMRELNLRDNRLTDKGLMPIIKAIKQRRDLYALDLSENKLDRWAARQLALYFSDPRITLAKFVLSKADVDDFEAANFVKNMRNNTTLTYLDMSHNLIGSQESINYVRPEFYTGAEALADWVSTENCPLKYLDVSWNTIRLDSAVYFGNALARASHLEKLDLSFNCFGDKGGEAIGSSLHINTCLKKLGLASNAINPRACFVIGQGLRCNSSIQCINLSNNVLGKVGVGWIVALTAEVGDRIDIQLSNCNFGMECKDGWFDDDELKSSYQLRTNEPYDRAVAVHLIRRAARDEGLKLKLVTYKSPGEEEKEIKLTRTVARSTRSSSFPERLFLEEVFSKYDKDGRGSLSRDDLQGALSELNLGGSIQVERVMARHANINGLVEEEDFHNFVQTSVLQSKKRDERCKGFMAEESKPGTRWIVPWDAQLRLKLKYTRLHNQVYNPSLEGTDGFVAMLMRIGDGVTEVMTRVLDHVSLDMEQGMKVYSVFLKHLGGDRIKALAKVIPRMEFLDDARLLKNMILRDLNERRKLRHEFGPAYLPLMGTPMGHYELDLAKTMHRLAARKVMECNNLEKLQRQAGRPLVFDVSQNGDWENIRNGTVNGRPSWIKGDILEAPLRAGTLTMDYVSTTRRPVKFEQGGHSHPAAMNAKKFHEMLRLAGILEDTEWTVDTSEKTFDQAIDEALSKSPPRPTSPTMLEYLHFVFTGERSDGSKKRAPLRPSALEKLQHLSGRKKSSLQSELGSGTLNTLRLAQRDDRPPTEESTRDTESKPTKGDNAGNLNAVSYRLDELIVDRWLSIRQCRFVLLALEEMFFDEEFLQDAVVDFVVTVYPRIVDIHDYMTLVGCVADSTAAFVIKRVGWLAAWNPCQPDGLIELALDRRDDRQMAKMFVHLFVEEGSESWASSSFRWGICDSPVPGWMLPAGWYTIEGLPYKGILKLEFRSGPSVNWSLRMALARTVTLCDILPREVLGIVDSECRIQDEAPRRASKSVTVDKRNLRKGVVIESGLFPDLKSLERLFDTNFVNALCRQAGRTFFLYGA